ncbi:phage protein Gp27 family protein [Clostridium lundense]|uniref:phage protein Gp27 family protein n=1 Tax=Clostridium lundense TaxID=319475 RepID=UPI0004837708|nr:phage protein Gp27 family protein [Clostridium lundense]
MGKERERTRIKCRIDEFPEEIKELINQRLADVNIGYVEIAEEVTELGYPISKSSIGRYAFRNNNIAKSLKESAEQMKVIVEAVKEDKNLDVIGAVNQMMAHGLAQRMAIAQEEMLEMPIDKAMRVAVQLERSTVYKEKFKLEYKRGVNDALSKLKEELKQELKQQPDLFKRMCELADKVAERMESENNE